MLYRIHTLSVVAKSPRPLFHKSIKTILLSLSFACFYSTALFIMAQAMAKLSGKVALITGASSGIGSATAVLFSQLGANLALSGRNMDNLKKTAEQCQVGDGQKKPLLVQGEKMFS